MAIYPPMCLDPKLGIFAGKAKPGDKTFDGEVRSVQRTGNIITITFKDGSTSTPKGPKVQQYSEFDVLGVGDSAIGEVVTEPEAENVNRLGRQGMNCEPKSEL